MPLYLKSGPLFAVVSFSLDMLKHLATELGAADSNLTFDFFAIPKHVNSLRPIIIVAAPRSGSTLLFETLSRAPEVWTLGHESHHILEFNSRPHPDNGNCLTADQADSKTRTVLSGLFYACVFDRESRLLPTVAPVTRDIYLLEKTPKNSLRIPFLEAIFPQALYIYLYREPIGNISSILDGWRAKDRFTSYLIDGMKWKFLLPPDWRSLIGRSHAEIATAQWTCANQFILNSLNRLPANRWMMIDYGEFVENPLFWVMRICEFCSLIIDERFLNYLRAPLAFSRSTLTAPTHEKWRKNFNDISPYLAQTNKIVSRLKDLRSLRSSNAPGSPQAL